MMTQLAIRPIDASDKNWVIGVLTLRWNSPKVVTRGNIYDASQLPGFICLSEGDPVGLITYCLDRTDCEIISVDSLKEGIGVGSKLIEAVREQAVRSGCRRLWLITTNDNLAALRFYQKRGFRLVAVHRDALRHSRKLKPEISHIGMFGIPLLDEIELELSLLQG
jgi:GNAT superfamily N-acetyltransferase